MFDSKAESYRYLELKLLEKAGEIENLKLQVKYELLPKQAGHRAVTYIADFVYFDVKNGRKLVVEDVKGVKTEVYKLKRKMMKYFHDIDIFETKRS